MKAIKLLMLGVLLLGLLPIAAAQDATGGPYTLTGNVTGGGGSSSGGVYTLVGSAGEFEAGSSLTGTPYLLVGGWRIPLPPLLGDCNNDGLLDAGDLSALNIVLGGSPAPSPACDVNYDGQAASNDSSCLRQRLFDPNASCSP